MKSEVIRGNKLSRNEDEWRSSGKKARTMLRRKEYYCYGPHTHANSIKGKLTLLKAAAFYTASGRCFYLNYGA